MRMKKEVLRRSALLAMLFLVSMVAWADRGGFYYENIRVDARVTKSNEWYVTERFDVVFNEPRHGIYRFIPESFSLRHDMADIVGGESCMESFQYESDIDDLEVEGSPYSTDTDNGNLVIRMGDPDYEVVGPNTYVIHYTYVYREDRVPTYDYLLHTILGTDFGEDIRHFSFRITFEKPLPSDIPERLKIYSGRYGNNQNVIDDLTVRATPTVIEGEASNVKPYHGITLYAFLPEGYYEDVLGVNHFWYYLFLVISILLILAIIVSLFIVRRGHITKSIEFYPPEGISSAEVGTIIDDSVDNEDIASLVPWMAGQGYLSIREVQKSGVLNKMAKKTDLEITKLRDLPADAPEYQRVMMHLLFRSKDVVKISEIGERPKTVERLKDTLKKNFKGERELTELKLGPVGLYLLLAFFGSLMLGSNSAVKTFDEDNMILSFLFFGLPFFGGFFIRLVSSGADIMGRWFRRLLFFIGKALCMMVVSAVYLFLADGYGQPMSLWQMALFIVICFILGECIGRFNVNTEYRLRMMGRLLGFKEFIQTAEKSRLESLQQDDPQYFYKILPYAMVFGLSSKWASLFKDIDVKQPDWYESSAPLMGYALTNHLVSNLNTTMNHAITTISHDSSSSGGSGGGGFSFGGGGFSGGGGGGGGGGSW